MCTVRYANQMRSLDKCRRSLEENRRIRGSKYYAESDIDGELSGELSFSQTAQVPTINPQQLIESIQVIALTHLPFSTCLV
jgi:hypothetical protein